MKKVVLLIVSTLIVLSSCANLKYNYRQVNDYGEKMELVKNNFPEVYRLYTNGDVVIDKVYTYDDYQGEPQVHISYHYRNKY